MTAQWQERVSLKPFNTFGIDVKARDGMLEVTVRPRRFAGIGLSEVTLAAPMAR